MTTYNTNNPMPSTDPRDLYDNSQALDEAVNGVQRTFLDRFGIPRKTIKGATDDVALSQGLQYDTLVDLNNSPGVVVGQMAHVTQDSIAANNGLYAWSGTQWVKKTDPWGAYLTMARRNGLIISGDITKVRFIGSAENNNALIIDHEEINIDFGAGRGYVKIAAATGIVVPLNRAYIVDLRIVDPINGPVVAGEVTVYDPTSGINYENGAFVDDLRIPLFVNRSSNNVARYGGVLSVKLEDYSTGDVWFSTSGSVTVSYDDSTRTLSSNGLIFCPFQANKSNRINLPAFSLQIPDITYQSVWIDKSMVPADGGNLPMTAIKVGGYNSDAETDYQSMSHQLVLFKRERAGKYGSIGDFPSIRPPLPPSNISTGLQFIKQVNSASLYFDGGNNNKVEIPLIREIVPFDGTSPNSQSDNWRLYGGYETDSERVRGNSLVNIGEWEMAIRIAGSTDSVGGYHGDELMTDATFFANGKPFAQNETRALSSVKSAGLIQNSFVYQQNVQADIDLETGQQTGLNAAIKHSKAYGFLPSGILVQQRAEFLQNLDLVSAWIAMLPMLRFMNFTSGPIITNRAYRSRKGIIDDISAWVDGSDPETLEVKEGDRFMIYGTTSGINAEIVINKLPQGVGNPKMYISTNTSAYNKFYLNMRGSSTDGDPNIQIAAGDVWLWEIFYKITTSN